MQTGQIEKAEMDGYYGHARVEVLPFLPADIRRIADIGGSSGATLTAIKARWPDATTICIDSHEPSLEQSRRRGHIAVACDLDNNIPDVVKDCDVVMLLDVLEHLVDPWSVLRKVVQLVPRGATVIVSVPNVRYWEVSFGLLFRGRWELRDAGVLDRTHLRFFTHDSGADLIRGAGLTLRATTANLAGGRRYALLDRVTLGIMSDFLRSQYLYVCTKE